MLYLKKIAAKPNVSYTTFNQLTSKFKVQHHLKLEFEIFNVSIGFPSLL
jgi:hypothetical protein